MGPLVTHPRQEDSVGLAGLNALLNIPRFSQAPPPQALLPHPRTHSSYGPSGRLHDRTGKPSADCRVPFAAKNGHLLYNNFSFKLTIPGNLLPCVCSPFDTTKAELPLACEYDLLSKVNVEGSTRRVQTRYQMHLE